MKEIHADKYREIGLRISYCRRCRGFTQEKLAEMVGLSAAYIGQVEAPNVKKAISLDVLFDVATVLNVSPFWFLLSEKEFNILDV